MREVVHQAPYSPRKAFLPYHERTKRWAAMVCHRRAGKTVAVINDLIRAALFCPSPFPHYAYIAPFRSQAKAVAWHYGKYFAEPVTKAVHEGELVITLINRAKLSLFGADNADALRGLGFDGVVCDEFGDWRPSVFPAVVRPALSDRQGWATFVGTPKGKNQFWDTYDAATRNDDWFSLSLPASKSGVLPQSELDDARSQLTEDAYAAEYECSFEAAILGAFYGVEMRQATEAGRIRAVGRDASLPVHTAWDLGYRDDTAIWFYQVVRGEIHIIDYYAISGESLEGIAGVIAGKGYRYGKHHLPHDARAKTLAAAGKSIVEQLAGLLGGMANLRIVPDLSVQDGIQAARLMLPRCYFDADKCRDGIEALRQYQREYDEDKKAFRQTPRHDWTSHPADAFRMLAIAWAAEPAPMPTPAAERPLIVGPGNSATLNDMWAQHEAREGRRDRI